MRGALVLALIAGLALGIIPADAGSTQVRTILVADDEDHPRGCGEHGIISYALQ